MVNLSKPTDRTDQYFLSLFRHTTLIVLVKTEHIFQLHTMHLSYNYTLDSLAILIDKTYRHTYIVTMWRLWYSPYHTIPRYLTSGWDRFRADGHVKAAWWVHGSELLLGYEMGQRCDCEVHACMQGSKLSLICGWREEELHHNHARPPSMKNAREKKNVCIKLKTKSHSIMHAWNF